MNQWPVALCSFAPRKAKNFKQHDLFVIYIYIVATYKTIKRTELTTVKLPLPFETHNLFNIGWVGGSLLRYNNYLKYLNGKLGRPMKIRLVNQEDFCRTIHRVQEDCVVVSGEYLVNFVNICVVLT